MSTQPSHRLTSRQASAQTQRKAMTERRQRLTQRIRKQKKSDWLDQKRGVTAASAVGIASNASSTQDLSQAVQEFLRQVPASYEALKQLFTALQSSVSWTLDDPSNATVAQNLIHRLGEDLAYAVANNDLDLSLILVQILLQLVALSASSKTSTSNNHNNQLEDSSGYYGRQSLTWTDLLVENFPTMASFPRILSIVSLSQAGVSSLNLQLVETVCWFLGNLAQEMPSFCPRLRHEGALVPHLTNILSLIQQQRSSETNTTAIIAVVQAATWAFHNLIKGDVTAWGREYCATTDHPGMHPGLASALLTLSVPVIQTELELQSRYVDISVQTAWILVQLSQREEDAVEFLLCSNDTSTDIFRNVLERLYQVCHGALQEQQNVADSMSSERPNYFHHPLLEPCLQVLGHWSIAGNGKHVPRLMAKTPGTSRVPEELSLLPILETLLQWGQTGLLQSVDYMQALWLSGCLLVDAGRSNHPSTALAVPSLVPLLTSGLIEQNNTSGSIPLECKREGACSLWNAISLPPLDEDENEEPVLLMARKKSVLRLMLFGNSNTDTEDTNTKSTHTVLTAFKNLLLCHDVDAMLAAMNVLNAILRHIPSSRVTFMEVNGEEALETVCDLPLGNDRASSDAADLAAALIDDFFGSDQFDDGQYADPILQPDQAGGTFVFGMDPALQQAPIFLPDLQTPDDNAGMRGLFPSIAPVGESVLPGMGRGVGRGRGRGNSLPDWALQRKACMDMT